MDFTLMHPRDQITLIMERIYGYGMTTTSGGNLSILDEESNLWITPAGTDKGSLGPADVVCIRPDGSMEGNHSPSSELPFHQALHARRPDIRAVLHAHPPALVSFSILKRIPDTRIIPKARSICGKVGYAPYAMPGSEELGDRIAEIFEKEFNTVLMENHGVVTVGDSLFDAFMRFETLDFCARLILKASLLGTPRPLAPDQLAMLEHKQNYLPEYDVEHRSSREKALRKEMVERVQRSYDQRLITSTEGTFSCRLDEESFIITPYGMDRKYLEAPDLIVICKGRRERGRIPSRSVTLHHRIYAEHPDIHAVIIAHPTNLMAFGVSKTALDTRIIPESYLVLRDIPVVPYGPQFNDVGQLSARFSDDVPLLMVENDCLITTGRDFLQAYDRLEVAEFTAKAVLASRPVGEIQPMPDAEIDRLRQEFDL